MGFGVPNDPAAPVNSAAFSDQAEPEYGDWAIVTAADEATGTLAGCTVTPGVGMTLDVAAGEIILRGLHAVVAAAAVAVTPADPALPRFDLVRVDATGLVTVLAGTPHVNPCYPVFDRQTHVILAAVYVPALTVATSAGMIVDKRVLVRNLTEPGRAKSITATFYAVPGAQGSSQGSLALVANTIYYLPWTVHSPIVVDELAIEVTVLALLADARIGIYHADRDWQPTNLVIDAGEVSVTTTGVKTIAVGITLQPGRYLGAINADGTPTLRAMRGGFDMNAVNPALGAALFVAQLTVLTAQAPFLPVGIDWTSVASRSTGFDHLLFARVASFA